MTSDNANTALILGSLAMARSIAASFAHEGFSPVIQEEAGIGLPNPSHEGASDELAALFSNLADKYGRSGFLVHPGNSVWAERPELPSICASIGIDVICPPAKVLGLFMNKLGLLCEAERLRIPVLLLHPEPMHSAREVRAMMAASGNRYPIVLKPLKDAGNAGIFVAENTADLEARLPLWLDRLRWSAGETAFYAEKWLECARVFVAPFARLWDGTFRMFGLVDASLKDSVHKLVEVCPADVDAPVFRQIEEWTRSFAVSCGYLGVGTLEFLTDGARIYLSEGAPRLNTGFRLWETVSAECAAAWQLAAMENGPAQKGGGGAPINPGPRAVVDAHAVSARIYSELSLVHLPQPGFVSELAHPPGGASLELVPGCIAGRQTSTDGDGIAAIVIGRGRSYRDALESLRAGVDGLWFAGSLQTNTRFMKLLLSNPRVRERMFHSCFVEEEFIPEGLQPGGQELSLIVALASVCVEDAATGRWYAGNKRIESSLGALEWSEGPFFFEHAGRRGVRGVLSGGAYGGKKERAGAFPLQDGRWIVRVGSQECQIRRTGASGAAGPPSIRALCAGRMHAALFRAGAVAPPHEPVALVESQRTLVQHSLPVRAKITRWLVNAGSDVGQGQILAECEIIKI